MTFASTTPIKTQGSAIKRPSFATSLELLKPITWFPPMWAFMCGVVSTGLVASESWLVILAGIVLVGPLVCAMSQAINDWHDRHVDAINEPDRPIPSGRMPGRWGLYIAVLWSLISLVFAAFLGTWVFVATVVGLTLAWAYSAPPFRFKQNGWMGNTVCAICYEGLAWFTGAALLVGGWPDLRIVMLAILYSAGAHGIMTLNDFKSIQGDQQMDVKTIPVLHGAENAARIASVIMVVPQIVVSALLYSWGLPAHAAVIAILLMVQIGFMFKFLLDGTAIMNNPRKNAAFYNLFGVTLFVAGMLVSAFGIGSVAGVVS